MEEYINTLKKRLTIWKLLLLFSVAGIGIFFIFGSVLFGMDVELRRAFGAMFGFLFIFSLCYFVTDSTTLGSDNKLREQYIRNIDERNLSIEAKSSRVTLNIVMICLFISFIVMSLFIGHNAGTVPGICFYGIWLIKSAVKYYYNKKM